MSEEIIAKIPQDRDDTLLEVALIHDDQTGPRIELRSLLWGTGLGWYRWKTLTMERSATRELIQSLSQASRRMGGASATDFDRKVIPFPNQFVAQAPAEPQAM